MTPRRTRSHATTSSPKFSGIELVDLDAVQLRAGSVSPRCVVVRAGTAAVAFHPSNVHLPTRTSCAEGLVGHVVFGPRSSATVNGIPVRAGLMLAAGLGAEAGFVVDAGWESITFLLPAQDLHAHLAARKRPSLLPPPREIVVLAAEPVVANDLFAWGKRLTKRAAAQPEVFHDGAGMRAALQVEIIENLLAAIGMAMVFEPGRSDRTRQRRSRIVKLAEEYTLAQITGVSERALEYGFKEVMGMTPVAFLAKPRLHRVRQAPIAATPGATTVAAEALR